ncbi:MAG: hypothetical protein WAM78_07570 [Candidatus Sulfotelmatobacter sp.]
MTNASYGRLTVGIIAAWFAFAFSASALHVFETKPGAPPLPVGISALAPIVVFLIWFAASASFRRFTLSLNPSTLTFVQSWRIAGLTFLTLYAIGLLPGFFALPAGLGDIAIGATAPWAALKLANFSHRRGFLFWQVLGMIDLVTAVTSGTTAGLISPHGVPTAVMTVLPMSLIPTFAVPLFFILHIICIAQARHWKAVRDSEVEERFPAAAEAGPRMNGLSGAA